MMAYKVVRRRADGRKLSAVIESEARVEYIIGRPVRGCEGTPLFVFEDLANARWWARVNGVPDFEIWECRIKLSRRTKFARMGVSATRALCKTIVRFWRDVSRDKDYGYVPLPKTLFCQEVTLLRRVETVSSATAWWGSRGKEHSDGD